MIITKEYYSRKGVTATEVLVVAAIVFTVVCGLMVALPRMRENARGTSCQWNLRNIGQALVLHDQLAGALPTVPESAEVGDSKRRGPLASLLDELGQEDFAHLEKVDKTAKKKGSKGSEKLSRVPGFICPSDSTAFEASFTRPVSYRATTGDTPTGSNGAFALGRIIDLAKLDAQDGLGYTAAFSERLVGNGRERSASPNNYALLAGPVSAEVGTSPAIDLWRGDAGSDWREATWRSTLYNHSIVPGASPSLIAGDGRSARMGASSGHGNHVFVLMLDGKVQRVSYDVDPVIWRALANSNDIATVKPAAKPKAERP